MDRSLINKIHSNLIDINYMLKHVKHDDLNVGALNMLKSTAYSIASVLSSIDKNIDDLNNYIDQSYKSILRSISILNIETEFSREVISILDNTIPLLNRLKNILKGIGFSDLSSSEFYSLWELSEIMANFLKLTKFVDVTGEVDDVFKFAEEGYNFKSFAKDDEYIDNSDE